MKAKPSETWISEPGFIHYYTDSDGVDHDIVKTIADCKRYREALDFLKVLTAPGNTILPLTTRIASVYQIATEALEESK